MTLQANGQKFKILVADRPSPLEYYDRKAAEVGAEVIYGNASKPEEVEPLVEDVDAVIVFRTYVSDKAIARMKQCKILLRQGIGFDLIDVPAATRAGIYVSNVPDYCVDEVATHAMALMLASIRNLMDYHRVMTSRGWGWFNASRKVFPIDEMTIGIVGLGKIGRAFARKAAAFGSRLIAYDPYVHQDVFDWMGCERIRNLDDLLKQSDVVSLHTPLTPETKGMFGEREFGLMKKGAHFVNTARGRIVKLDALHAALENHLAAAAIDVFEDEPLDPNHAILKRANLIATPHVAFYSERAIIKVVTESIDEVARVLRGERPLNLVNPEVFAHRRA